MLDDFSSISFLTKHHKMLDTTRTRITNKTDGSEISTNCWAKIMLHRTLLSLNSWCPEALSPIMAYLTSCNEQAQIDPFPKFYKNRVLIIGLTRAVQCITGNVMKVVMYYKIFVTVMETGNMQFCNGNLKLWNLAIVMAIRNYEVVNGNGNLKLWNFVMVFVMVINNAVMCTQLCLWPMDIPRF